MATQSFIPKNIIVRMPNWLGDLVMSTPILHDLRHHFPDAKITAMCPSSISSLLLEDPHINELISFNRPGRWLNQKAKAEIIDPLRNGNYNCAILLTNSFSSAWWFWRAGIKNRIGYPMHLRRFLLDRSVPIPKEIETQHLVITYKMLLESLEIPLSATPPSLYLTLKEQSEARELLQSHGVQLHHRLIGMNPGAAYGSAKCWPADRFKELTAKLLQNPNVEIIFFGDKAGAPLVNEICAGYSERVTNLAGKTTIRQLMSLLRTCDVLLTNDSGPMHIASALGTPLLALFGSTNDRTTGPYKGAQIIHKHVTCSPCYRRECPIDFRCMTSISAEEVYGKLLDILKTNQK
jgi:heptosyltransferase II